jgi:hypothetical protein
MWQLILKDFEQHAKTILVFFLSALILPIAFGLFFSQTENNAGYLGVVFGYIMLGAPALFAFWFIGQEKMKGTFKLLSILPIPGRKLILVKSLASAILCLSVINLVAVIIPAIFQTIIGLKWLPSLRIIVWVNLLTIFFASVDITIFTLLETKIASQAIYLGHAFVGFAIIIAARHSPLAGDPELLLQRLNAIGFHYWGGILIIALSYLLVALSGRIFEMKEWADLEEG